MLHRTDPVCEVAKAARIDLKNWTLVLVLAVIGVLFALDGRRVELLREAARRFLPHGPTGVMVYRFEEPAGLSAYLDDFREAALDPDRPDLERLGAAELYRVAAMLAGDSYEGEAFNRHFEVLLDVAIELAYEPAAVALVVDTLRAHRAVLGRLGEDQEAIETVLVRDVLRLARSQAPSNGFFELFACETALSEGRHEEARDALLRAARMPCSDSMLRQRSASAYAFLRARGLPDLEAREFLIDDVYSGQGLGPGELLDDVAQQLGALDTGAAELRPELWMETFLAVHTLGVRLLETALLSLDGQQAVSAEGTYLQAVGGTRTVDGSPIPRGVEPGFGGEQLRQQLVSAGFTHGAALLDSDRVLVQELLSPSGAGPGSIGSIGRSGRSTPDSGRAIQATAAHALFVPWIALSLLIVLLLSPAAVRARRRQVPVPSSPGIFVIAALTPVGLLLYLGSRGLFPFERVGGVAHFLNVLAEPPPAIFLMPLVSCAVIALQHLLPLGQRRYLTLGAISRRLSSFYLVFAILLFLAFAATAPILDQRRQARLESLSSLIVSPADQAAWPALHAES